MISNIMGCQEEEAGGADSGTITLTSLHLTNIDATARIAVTTDGETIELPAPARPAGPTLDDMWSIQLVLALADFTFTDNAADTISISAGFVGSSSIVDEYYGNKFYSAVADGLPIATGSDVATGAVSSTYLGSYNPAGAGVHPPLNLDNGATSWLLACNPTTTFIGSTDPGFPLNPTRVFIDILNAQTLAWLPLSAGIVAGLPSGGAQIDYISVPPQSALTNLLTGTYPPSPYLTVDQDIAGPLVAVSIDVNADTTMAGYVNSVGGTSNPFTVCVPSDLAATGTPQLRIIIDVDDATGNSESLTLNFPISYV